MVGKLTSTQVMKVALVGIGLGAAPHGLGFLLGFAAFVITPILVPLLGVWGGTLIARIARNAPWTAVALASVVTAASYVGASFANLAALAALNGAWLQTLPILDGALMFVAVGVIAAVLISIGAWFGARREQRVSTPQN
jgi:hypothetical protein